MKQILLNQIAEARAQIAQLSSDVSSTAMDVSALINVAIFVHYVMCHITNAYLIRIITLAHMRIGG